MNPTISKSRDRSWILLSCLLLVAGLPGQVPGQPPEQHSADATGPAVVLLDGKVLRGAIRGIRNGTLVLGEKSQEIPFYEVQEVRFARGEKKTFDHGGGPLVRFRGGELLVARVSAASEDTATVLVESLGELSVPLQTIGAFRLREQHPKDDLFEKDLKNSEPEEDTVYVRRSNLLRVSGTFRGLTKDFVTLEYKGAKKRLRRQLVQGVALAPTASAKPEADPAAIFAIRDRGEIPAYLQGWDEAAGVVKIRMPGASKENVQTLPLAMVERISFASDRVVFLSDLEPSRVEETPVLGRALHYRKDQSVGGGPLTLARRVYRRGLGVHSHAVLEYSLKGKYRTFAAVIGLDDAVGARGSVTFRIAADGKELLQRDMEGKDSPESVSVPLDGVDVLRLEVDYGGDELDVGDHADWADARVTRRSQ